MTDCARFEAALVALLDAGSSAPARGEELERLARHARECPECAGAGDLLALLALPEAERDLVEAPGESYWAEFDERLRGRIAGPGASAAVPVVWARWAAALAAAAALGAAVAWIGGLDPRTTAERAPGPPTELSELLARSEPADALGELERLAGLEGPWSDATALVDGAGDPNWEDGALELFPEARELEPEARGELLHWLLRQDSPNQGVSS